ncbi:MAG: alpha/beta hydrolase [Pseudomonadota bacterium]|jgi:pimeloyl-ACP methyl ester carboxylesterase
MSPVAEFVNVDWSGRNVRLEYQWLAPERTSAPLIIFLHEGLGSLSMWRDFPKQLCDAVGARGLVYSRPGYGQSTPRGADEVWGTDFMHKQAHIVLPALLQALGIDAEQTPPWLLGHSDGGSIALLYAAQFPRSVAGLILLAPHIMVEDITIKNIVKARAAYETTDLPQRLAKHHAQPDSAFWGWNRVWLSTEFRSWSIETHLPKITCPVLAIQGLDDEYGTVQQVHGIAQRVPQTKVLEIPQCGHSPHRDAPQQVINAVFHCIHNHH